MTNDKELQGIILDSTIAKVQAARDVLLGRLIRARKLAAANGQCKLSRKLISTCKTIREMDPDQLAEDIQSLLAGGSTAILGNILVYHMMTRAYKEEGITYSLFGQVVAQTNWAVGISSISLGISVTEYEAFTEGFLKKYVPKPDKSPTARKSTRIKSTGVPEDTSCAVPGVSWHTQSKKWRAFIGIQGKTKHLGLYNKQADAITARLQAESSMGRDK